MFASEITHVGKFPRFYTLMSTLRLNAKNSRWGQQLVKIISRRAHIKRPYIFFCVCMGAGAIIRHFGLKLVFRPFWVHNINIMPEKKYLFYNIVLYTIRWMRPKHYHIKLCTFIIPGNIKLRVFIHVIFIEVRSIPEK